MRRCANRRYRCPTRMSPRQQYSDRPEGKCRREISEARVEKVRVVSARFPSYLCPRGDQSSISSWRILRAALFIHAGTLI